jgi:RNA polymerase subunit RPABC4/transcription elongation factor Spt4
MIINPADIVACSKCGAVYNSKKKECPVCKNGAFDFIDFKNKK